LGRFVHATHCGYLCLNNTGVIVERAPDTVLGPDVAFYTGAKAMEELDWFFARTPPHLAVEVGSADDRFTGVDRRVMWFHKCGVQAVWFVDPDERAVTVHQAGATVCVLEEADELSGGEALPGFRCRVAEFFALPGR
jgi:Uma2 family endonuclease